MKRLGPNLWLIDFYLSGRSSRRIRAKVTGTERDALLECGRLRAVAEGEERAAAQRKRSHSRDFRWLTTGEYAEVCGGCGQFERAALDVLLITGLRVSDFVALDESMLRGGVLAVPIQKTGITLYQRCPDELARLVRTVAGRWQYSKARRFVRAVTKRAGLKEAGPHILRHTCASWMVQADIPIYRVKEHLGHASLQTTQRYAHLSATVDFEEAMQHLPEQTRTLVKRVWLREKNFPAKSSLFVLDKSRKVV